MRLSKIFLALIVISSLMASASFAAKSNGPKPPIDVSQINRTQSIIAYPLGVLLGRFGVGYSFQVSDYLALTPSLMAGYLGAGAADNASSVFSIGPAFGARFFLSDTAFNSGWYIEPNVSFGYAQYGDVGHWSFGAQATAGYAWYWDGGFTLNLGGGLAYAYYPNFLNAGFWLSFPHPTVDFALGYSW